MFEHLLISYLLWGWWNYTASKLKNTGTVSPLPSSNPSQNWVQVNKLKKHTAYFAFHPMDALFVMTGICFWKEITKLIKWELEGWPSLLGILDVDKMS